MKLSIDRINNAGVFIASDKANGEYSGKFISAAEFDKKSSRSIAELKKNKKVGAELDHYVEYGSSPVTEKIKKSEA